MCVQSFEVRKAYQLRYVGFVADIAGAAGVLLTPLLGGFAEQRHVQQVGLAGVYQTGLLRGQRGRNQVRLDGIGVDAVVDLGEITADVPAQLFPFLVFKALKLFDEVNFEFGADPHVKLKGNVLVSVGAAVAPSLGHQTNGIGLRHPFFDAEFVAVEPGLTSNCGESAIIKRWIVYLLPDTQKLYSVAVAQPVGNEKITVFGFEHVGQRNKVHLALGEYGNFCAFDFNLGHAGFLAQCRSSGELLQLIFQCTQLRIDLHLAVELFFLGQQS